MHDGNVQCGWCLGGDIVYNDTGKSPYKCAGFVAGQPKAFTCTMDFRTEDCSGISCNWTMAQPQCYKSSNGQYSDMTTCQETCKSAEFAFCNPQSKQCVPCTQGAANCTLTEPECQATCNVPHAKCNTTTKQCTPCDPSTDPDCIDTQGYCEEQCNQQNTYGICDPTSGQCVTCTPSDGEVGEGKEEKFGACVESVRLLFLFLICHHFAQAWLCAELQRHLPLWRPVWLQHDGQHVRPGYGQYVLARLRQRLHPAQPHRR